MGISAVIVEGIPIADKAPRRIPQGNARYLIILEIIEIIINLQEQPSGRPRGPLYRG